MFKLACHIFKSYDFLEMLPEKNGGAKRKTC
jgi:hypothetical protein